MSLGEGQTFAGYTVVRRLGAGGMGEVYLAQHPRLPRRDAVKLLAGAISSDANFRERFLREADLASTLWHPHIVGVHDRGEDDGRLWISMDFVDGEDAGSLMARRYPDGLPRDLVVKIVTAVGSALDYAHGRSLLHRDVKPANIMLTNVDDGGEPRILLTDFGIARTVDDDSGLTATNMTLGTVAYTSPEQLMGEDVDGRADQYSLASTAYQLLTGASLFAHTNAAVVISRHLSSPPPVLADARPELADLDPVLARALAKDPGSRFADCSTFARALAQPGAQPPAESTVALAASAPPTARVADSPSPLDDGQAKTSLVATTPPVRRVSADAPEVPKPTATPAPKPAAAVALPPGWYQDPGGRGGSAYWDGTGWHAPAAAPTPHGAGQNGNRHGPLLAVLGIAVAVVLLGSLAYLFSRDDGATTVAGSGSSTSRTPATSTSTTYRQSGGVGDGESPYPPPPPPPPPAPATASSTIVGTCDEGGSCGVKQRTAPFVAAPRLVPNDLRDGAVVTMVCQTTGDVRSSEGHGSSTVWYRLDNGAYVNSVYLSNPAGVPTC